jgi:hypothetical protein
VGEDREDRARRIGRRTAAIDASITTLDPIWYERFDADIASDTAFERSLLVREWAIVLVIFLSVLMVRLFA